MRIQSVFAVNGIQLCRQIRATPNTADAIVIVVTGSIDPADEQAAIGAGANRFMSKPFSPRMLLETIEQVACGTAS